MPKDYKWCMDLKFLLDQVKMFVCKNSLLSEKFRTHRRVT